MPSVIEIFNNYNFQNLRRIQTEDKVDGDTKFYFSKDIDLVAGITIPKYSKIDYIYFQDLTPPNTPTNQASIDSGQNLILLRWQNPEGKLQYLSIKPFTVRSSTLVLNSETLNVEVSNESEIKSIFAALSSRPVSEDLFSLPSLLDIYTKLKERIQSINNSNKKALVQSNISIPDLKFIIPQGAEAKLDRSNKIDFVDKEDATKVYGSITFTDANSGRISVHGPDGIVDMIIDSKNISQYLNIYNTLNSISLVPGAALAIGAQNVPLDACNVKIPESEFDKAYIDWGQEIKGWIPKIEQCANEIAYIASKTGLPKFGRRVDDLRNAAKATNTSNAWNSKAGIDEILVKYSELVNHISANDLWKRASADGGHSCETAIKCFTDVMVRKPCLEQPTPEDKNPAPPSEEEPSTEGTTPKCMEVSPERWGVRFRYRDGGGACSTINTAPDNDIRFDLESAQQRWPGYTYDWFLMLLPAMRSVIPNSGGMDTPNAMPGLQFQIKSNIAKHRLPGFQPVYQHLGVDTVLVTLVGTFTGDGGLGAKYGNFQEHSGYGSGVDRDVSVDGLSDPLTLPDTRKNEDGVSYGAITGGGQVGVNTISPQYEPWDKREPVSAGFEVGSPMSGHPIVESTNNRVETLMSYNSNTGERVPGLDIKNSRGISTMEQNLMGAGMFMRDGCPWTCDSAEQYQGYREESRGDYAAGYQDALNPDVTNTHSLLEIASYLDSYHEFSSFYKFAVLEGRELEVEINLRRNRDMMQPMPNSFLQYGREATGVGLRNDANGNPSFKGLVKQMEVFHAKSDRTWYTIQIELTDYGMLGQEPLNLTNDLTEAASAALLDQQEALEANEEALEEETLSTEELNRCFNQIQAGPHRYFDEGDKRYIINTETFESIEAIKINGRYTPKVYNNKSSTINVIKALVKNQKLRWQSSLSGLTKTALRTISIKAAEPDVNSLDLTNTNDYRQLISKPEAGFHPATGHAFHIKRNDRIVIVPPIKLISGDVRIISKEAMIKLWDQYISKFLNKTDTPSVCNGNNLDSDNTTTSVPPTPSVTASSPAPPTTSESSTVTQPSNQNPSTSNNSNNIQSQGTQSRGGVNTNLARSNTTNTTNTGTRNTGRGAVVPNNNTTNNTNSNNIQSQGTQSRGEVNTNLAGLNTNNTVNTGTQSGGRGAIRDSSSTSSQASNIMRNFTDNFNENARSIRSYHTSSGTPRPAAITTNSSSNIQSQGTQSRGEVNSNLAGSNTNNTVNTGTQSGGRGAIRGSGPTINLPEIRVPDLRSVTQILDQFNNDISYQEARGLLINSKDNVEAIKVYEKVLNQGLSRSLESVVASGDRFGSFENVPASDVVTIYEDNNAKIYYDKETSQFYINSSSSGIELLSASLFRTTDIFGLLRLRYKVEYEHAQFKRLLLGLLEFSYNKGLIE